MIKCKFYILLLIVLCFGCGEETEKKQRLEENLQITLVNLQSANEAIQDTYLGMTGTFEQAIAGVQATGGSKELIAQFKICQDVALLSYHKFLEIDSLLLNIQNQEYWYDGKDVRRQMYEFREMLCQFILTKHPKNEPIMIDFEGLELEFEKDSASFNTEIKFLLKDLDAKDALAVEEICQMLSLPEKVRFGNQDKLWWEANFNNDLQVANAINIEAIRTRLLKAGYVALYRFAKWVQLPKFDFNTIEIGVTSNNGIVKSGSSLVLDFTISAYDSNEVAKIHYWIDDPEMKGAPFLFEGMEDCKIELSNQTLGKHTLYGLLSVMNGETEHWNPWTYDYFIAE